MGRGSPAGSFQHVVYVFLRNLFIEVTTDRAPAPDRIQKLRLVFRRVERAPGGDFLGTDHYNRVLPYLHAFVLLVFTAQKPDGGGVLLCSRFDQLRRATHHDESQQAPVLAVTVGYERDSRVLQDVPHPLEPGRRNVFGLFVQGYVDGARRVGEADGDGVRLTFGVGRGEACDSLAHEKGCLVGS